MKILSCASLAAVLASALIVAPILANSPFDVQDIKVTKSGNTKTGTKTVVAKDSSKADDSSAKTMSGIVTASILNIRSTPWGDIIGTYKKGDKIKIIGQLGDWYKVNHNGKTGYIHGNWVTTANKKGQTAPKYGVVSNCYWLNVRRAPSGDILNQIQSGTRVYIIGEVGGWYKIKYNNNEAFVSKKYIDLTNSASSVTSIGTKSSHSSNIAYSGSSRAVSAGKGTLQQKIVASARSLVGSTSFRGRDVSGGRLACAKVATTALKNAGALEKVHLNCRSAVKDLKAHGWKEVSAPPYQEGDVITWKTYDYTGDGIKDPDTHIGIIVKDGNTYKAMNNSSSLKTPRITSTNIAPVTRVLRKC